MENLNKELPKALTIEELKNRVGKPVFITSQIHLKSNGWNVLREVAERKDLLYKYVEFIDGLTITYDKVNDFRFFDTEVSETELKEILDAEEKKKKTGYERVEIEKDYYTITSTKDVTDMREYDVFNANNEKRYKNGNYFNDEALAENIARAERLRYQLRRYAALNGGIPSPSDWEDTKSKKYYILYDYEDNGLDVCDRQSLKDFGQIYFKDIEACKNAIEIFKKELIWYFTEFEEQLY